MEHSSASSILDSLLAQSSTNRTPHSHSFDFERRRPSCCCGRPKCAYLEHNNSAIEGLENEVLQTARIGQVRFIKRVHTTLGAWGRHFLFPKGVLVRPRTSLCQIYFLSSFKSVITVMSAHYATDICSTGFACPS